jgi:histidinol-phosphate aminotransferase
VTDPLRHVHPWLRDAPVFAVGEPPADALRLDLNEGAYGPTRHALDAIEQHAARLNRYPDPVAGHGLRDALARELGVDPETLLFGAGSNSLQSLLIRICAGPGTRVAYTWPGFPTFGWAASRCGATPVPVAARSDGSDDLDALAAAARDASVVVLATPANPTGQQVKDGLAAFIEDASRHALVLIDEAYHEYARPAPSGLDAFCDGAEVVVLRTFSKAWGLAGMRIGYAIMPPVLRAVARSAQDTFEVSTLAFTAALGSLRDRNEVTRRVTENAQVRASLEQTLARVGIDYWPSSANFVCARPAQPDRFVERMAAEGVIIRTIAAFGDPTRVRIGVPKRDDFRRLERAIEASVA